MKKIYPLVISLLLLSNCTEEKKEALVSKSPDGNTELHVSGKRENFLTAWNVELLAKGKDLKGNINFEFFGKDLSDEYITFAWQGNDKCTVAFTQKDGSKRVFEFTPNSTEQMWKDLSEK
jgi:hypothetical protein